MTKPEVPHLSDGRRGERQASDDGYASLVTAAAEGDRAALERLLVLAQSVAYRFSLAVCGRAEDAEDVMQDALLKAYRHVARIRDPKAFRPWLYRTVRNACLMNRRKRVDEPAHVLSLEELLPGPDGVRRIDVVAGGRNDPEAVASNRRLRRQLQQALAALPKPYRAVVFLREMEGLSTREVAHVLAISEENVKTRLHRARLFLQQQLGAAKETGHR